MDDRENSGELRADCGLRDVEMFERAAAWARAHPLERASASSALDVPTDLQDTPATDERGEQSASHRGKEEGDPE